MAHARLLDTSLLGDDCRELSYHLINDPLFVPDVIRDVKRVMGVMGETFNVCQQPFALVNDKNELGGVFFMSDLVVSHEGTMYIWVWKKDCVTPTTLRFMEDYVKAIADEYQLCRVVARTPCKKLCRLLKALKFKEEGRFSRAFRSDGRSLNLYQFRRLF